MTIADTIKSLKPGDRVRVTFVGEYIGSCYEAEILMFLGAEVAPAMITSIEVIEHPLQLGEEVYTINGHQATILAIAEDHAMLKFRDKSIGISNFKNLKRV